MKAAITPTTPLRLVEFNHSHADDLLSWAYAAPYHFYDPPQGDKDRLITSLIDPSMQFHAIEDDHGFMLGYCSYGDDGQLSGYDYQTTTSIQALDIGLGMRPNLTGQGLGKAFFSAILKFAMGRYETHQFRLTVASFNLRAIKLYCHFGFSETDQFIQPRSNQAYKIMTATIQESDLAAASK